MSAVKPTVETQVIVPGQKNSVCLSPKWWVDKTKYNPVQGHYKLHICGEDAFGAIEAAYRAATKSIDIICWGFQPSMYYTRNGNGKMIGQILEDIAATGKVQIRILIWFNQVGQTSEHNLPGYNSSPPATTLQLALENANNQINTSEMADGLPIPYASDAQTSFDYAWFARIRSGQTKNIQFHTRDFSYEDSHKIESALNKSTDKGNIGIKEKEALMHFPTHHQKMVLVDYEAPDKATGFVMGHNMTSQYWDTPAHHARVSAPNRGRDGPMPFQDNSGQVSGPILFDMNANFCQAWDKETGEGLQAKRLGIVPKASAIPVRPFSDADHVTAQICRTQVQHGDTAIETLYLQTVRNARRYLYLENQYFRFVPLVESIKTGVKQLIASGKDPNKHGTLHLFVITNPTTNQDIHKGSQNTYRMLQALGREDTMPAYTKVLQENQIDSQMSATENQLYAESIGSGFLDAKTQQQQAQDIQKLQQLQQQKKDIEKNEIKPRDIAGLKVHVCTLVSMDTPPPTKPETSWLGNEKPFSTGWTQVYVHSKLMLLDDVFITQGSANLNIRSMEVDSELNIAVPDHVVAAKYRKALWGLHTAGQGNQLQPEEAFAQWDRLQKNNKYAEKNGRSPVAPIISYYDNQKSTTNLD